MRGREFLLGESADEHGTEFQLFAPSNGIQPLLQATIWRPSPRRRVVPPVTRCRPRRVELLILYT